MSEREIHDRLVQLLGEERATECEDMVAIVATEEGVLTEDEALRLMADMYQQGTADAIMPRRLRHRVVARDPNLTRDDPRLSGMKPDVILLMIRNRVAAARSAPHAPDDLAELFSKLDSWLSRGFPLPTRWLDGRESKGR